MVKTTAVCLHGAVLYFPNHLNIETSDACNRRCAFCPVQRDRLDGPPQLLDLDIFGRLLDELGAAPGPLTISLQWIDEPLLNPRLQHYIELGRERLPGARWLLQSNGDLLTTENYTWLRQSFDAIAVNAYAAKVAQRIEALPLEALWAQQSERIQPAGRLRRAPGQAGREAEALLHINRKWQNQDWVDTYDRQQQPDDAPCTRLWVQAAIGWDGAVHLCCRDHRKANPVGNLRDQSLLQAYNSEPARRLRAAMQSGRRHRMAMCRVCAGNFANRFAPLAGQAEKRELASHAAHFDGALDEHGPPMPWGDLDYATARSWARDLGHLALPGYLPLRYEVVVGLTPALARQIVAVVRAELGTALRGLWICGSRVVTRPRLKQLDPVVFRRPAGLRVGSKTSLREYGPDPRRSSDLDLKILAAEELIDADEAARLSRRIGRRLEGASPHIPISGHLDPLLQVLRVPGRCADAREAFAYYNERRPRTLGKVALSLEYTQLLLDPADPVDWTATDATTAVRARLRDPGSGDRRAGLAELIWSSHFVRQSEDLHLRARFGGLTGHQWICALQDFVSLEPPGVQVDSDGRIRRGALAAWAAVQAGRSAISVASAGC